MVMYAPPWRRVVFLVCLDRGHRVALLRMSATHWPARLTLPTTQRRQRESYDSAARRLMARLAPAGTLRQGDLVGRIEAPPFPYIRRQARVYTAHTKEEHPRLHTHGDETLVWRPRHQVADDVAHLAIPELTPFIQGYIEGWIPSGWITLTPQL